MKKYDEIEVNTIVEAERRNAAIEAQQIGFDLGRQAQSELYALAEKPISKEALHDISCPECKSKIHIPCINYVLATKDRAVTGREWRGF